MQWVSLFKLRKRREPLRPKQLKQEDGGEAIKQEEEFKLTSVAINGNLVYYCNHSDFKAKIFNVEL